MEVQKKILENIIEQIIADNHLEDTTVSIEELSSGGANYTSVIYRIIIKSKKEDLDLFAKVACLSDASRESMPVHLFYKAENFVYHNLVEIYNNIQEKYNVPINERFRFPKFYGSNSNVKQETVVLENLVAQGYEMYDRMKCVTWDYASKAIEELAKFHALSYAYQHDNPEEFALNGQKLNIRDSMNLDVVRKSFENMASIAYPFLSEDQKIRLQKFATNSWTEETFDRDYGRGKWPVLSHGDYRSSNILHKIENGKVSSLIPIDYQTIRLSSPSTDLLYFIYSGTDAVFRKLYMKMLINQYYSTLVKFLKYFQLDPKNVLSRDNFDEDFKDRIGHGLCTAIFTLPIILVDAAKAPNMSDEGSSLLSLGDNLKPNDAYKERLVPIIEDFINFGLL